jgi:hypothetical protein
MFYRVILGVLFAVALAGCHSKSDEAANNGSAQVANPATQFNLVTGTGQPINHVRSLKEIEADKKKEAEAK